MPRKYTRKDSLLERRAVNGMKYVRHGDGTATYYKDSSLAIFTQDETPNWASSNLRDKLAARRRLEQQQHVHG